MGFSPQSFSDVGLGLRELGRHFRYYQSTSDEWTGTQHFLKNCMCAQRRLRSACASAQADQSLRYPPEDALDPWLPTDCPAKILIRRRECTGWFESSLGAHAVLWEMLVPGSNFFIFWAFLVWAPFMILVQWDTANDYAALISFAISGVRIHDLIESLW